MAVGDLNQHQMCNSLKVSSSPGQLLCLLDLQSCLATCPTCDRKLKTRSAPEIFWQKIHLIVILLPLIRSLLNVPSAAFSADFLCVNWTKAQPWDRKKELASRSTSIILTKNLS